MIKILKKFKPLEWAQMIFSIVFIVVQVWLDLKLPDYMSKITMLIQTDGSTMGQILEAGGFMLLCALGSIVASFTVGYYAAKLSGKLAHRLRKDVYDSVNDFSLYEIQNFSTASLITRSTNDVTQIQSTVAMGLQILVKAPIMAIWAITKISTKNWQWSMATSVAVLILIAMLMVVIIFALPKFEKIQEQTDDLNHAIRENLTGLRVVRTFNAETYQEDKFEETNAILTKTNEYMNRIMAIMSPGMSLISSGLSLGIYWIGAFLISAAMGPERLTLFSDMGVYSSYAMQIIMGFMMSVMIFILLPRATVSARRINEVLDTQSSIKDGHSNKGGWSVERLTSTMLVSNTQMQMTMS